MIATIMAKYERLEKAEKFFRVSYPPPFKTKTNPYCFAGGHLGI